MLLTWLEQAEDTTGSEQRQTEGKHISSQGEYMCLCVFVCVSEYLSWYMESQVHMYFISFIERVLQRH